MNTRFKSRNFSLSWTSPLYFSKCLYIVDYFNVTKFFIEGFITRSWNKVIQFQWSCRCHANAIWDFVVSWQFLHNCYFCYVGTSVLVFAPNPDLNASFHVDFGADCLEFVEISEQSAIVWTRGKWEFAENEAAIFTQVSIKALLLPWIFIVSAEV